MLLIWGIEKSWLLGDNSARLKQLCNIKEDIVGLCDLVFLRLALWGKLARRTCLTLLSVDTAKASYCSYRSPKDNTGVYSTAFLVPRTPDLCFLPVMCLLS